MKILPLVFLLTSLVSFSPIGAMESRFLTDADDWTPGRIVQHDNMDVMHRIVMGVVPGIIFLILGLLLILGECWPLAMVNTRSISFLIQGTLKVAVAGVGVVLNTLGNIKDGSLLFGPHVLLRPVNLLFIMGGVVDLLHYHFPRISDPHVPHLFMTIASSTRIFLHHNEPFLQNNHNIILAADLAVLITTSLQLVFEESSGAIIARGYCLLVLGAWNIHFTILLQEYEDDISPQVSAQLLWDAAAILVLTLVVGEARYREIPFARRRGGGS